MDESDRVLVAALTARAVAMAGDMAVMDFADLRCAFERVRRPFSDGDEEVSGGRSEVGLALLFVRRHGRLHSSLHPPRRSMAAGFEISRGAEYFSPDAFFY